MPDWHPADLFTFVDVKRLHAAWFRDQNTLCVGCRTNRLGPPVHYFVRYDSGFPGPDSQDVLDAALALRDVRARFGDDMNMLMYKYDIDLEEFARQWRAARDEVSAAIFNRLKVISWLFASRWFYKYPA